MEATVDPCSEELDGEVDESSLRRSPSGLFSSLASDPNARSSWRPLRVLPFLGMEEIRGAGGCANSDWSR